MLKRLDGGCDVCVCWLKLLVRIRRLSIESWLALRFLYEPLPILNDASLDAYVYTSIMTSSAAMAINNMMLSRVMGPDHHVCLLSIAT